MRRVRRAAVGPVWWVWRATLRAVVWLRRTTGRRRARRVRPGGRARSTGRCGRIWARRRVRARRVRVGVRRVAPRWIRCRRHRTASGRGPRSPSSSGRRRLWPATRLESPWVAVTLITGARVTVARVTAAAVTALLWYRRPAGTGRKWGSGALLTGTGAVLVVLVVVLTDNALPRHRRDASPRGHGASAAIVALVVRHGHLISKTRVHGDSPGRYAIAARRGRRVRVASDHRCRGPTVG